MWKFLLDVQTGRPQESGAVRRRFLLECARPMLTRAGLSHLADQQLITPWPASCLPARGWWFRTRNRKLFDRLPRISGMSIPTSLGLKSS